MLFSVQVSAAVSQTRFHPKRIACAEMECAEMAKYVSDDVALMRTQCQNQEA
jgi:hypothetical protein